MNSDANRDNPGGMYRWGKQKRLNQSNVPNSVMSKSIQSDLVFNLFNTWNECLFRKQSIQASRVTLKAMLGNCLNFSFFFSRSHSCVGAEIEQ